MKNGRNEMRQEVDLGANICKMIKSLYFKNDSWPDCCKDVARKFSLFKEILRKFHNMDKKESLNLLNMVRHYREPDIEEVFAMQDEIFKKEVIGISVDGTPRYGNKVTWIPIPVENVELIGVVRSLVKESSAA